MPTRRRTIAGSTVLEYRSSPWRRKVDFPQPLGPMIAVTAFDAISRVTSSMARFSPYQTDRFFTWKVNGTADSDVDVEIGSVDRSARSITVRSGVAITKLTIRKTKLDHGRRTPACKNSNHNVNAKNPGDEDEGAGPSLAMPIVVRRDGVSKNLQRQRGDRLTQVMIPKSVPESGEKERRRFAADARQCQQNASNDPLGRSLHHDMHDCFPTAYPESKRGFAISIRH